MNYPPGTIFYYGKPYWKITEGHLVNSERLGLRVVKKEESGLHKGAQGRNVSNFDFVPEEFLK